MKSANLPRWLALWRELGAPGDGSPAYRRLASAYGEPHRCYHNLRHIGECLEEFDAILSLASEPVAIEAAIWFHDAIYDPSSTTNEEESAHLAGEILGAAGVAPALIAEIRQLILTTKFHEASPNTDAALLVDVDIAILGKPPARFEEYECEIREEYFWVEPEIYGAKRADILTHFIARSFIFSTDYFRLKYENAARQNLSHSLEQLKKLAS